MRDKMFLVTNMISFIMDTFHNVFYDDRKSVTKIAGTTKIKKKMKMKRADAQKISCIFVDRPRRQLKKL